MALGTDGSPSSGQKTYTDRAIAPTPPKVPKARPPKPTGTGAEGGTQPNAPVQDGLSNTQRSALAYLRQVLDQYGLGSLAEWAADELRKGYDEAVVLQHLRDTPEFHERFKVIFDRQEAGLPPISPAQVVDYERTAAQLMGRFGLPQGFYDNYEDFHDLLARDVSPQELQARLESGYAQVLNAPKEVRDVFREWYGANGDSALAAFFLDPDKAQPVLEHQLLKAQVAGSGRRFAFSLSEEEADLMARVGVDQAAADRGFAQLSTQRGLFDENLWDSGGDMTVGKEGVGAAFGLDGASQQKIERRVAERQAAFAGGGGALRTNDGVRGAGVADQ